MSTSIEWQYRADENSPWTRITKEKYDYHGAGEKVRMVFVTDGVVVKDGDKDGEKLSDPYKIGCAFLEVLGDPAVQWKDSGASGFILRVALAAAKL